jgi:glycosyltransferase involved in cell wall biosynthesis
VKQVTVNSDNLQFNLVEREWEEYHGITAAFITLNEEEQIVSFLKHIRPLVGRIVMIDGGSVDDTVKLAEKYVDTLKIIPFKGHFAEQKNAAMRLVYTDWTLFLDPDERFSDAAFKQIPDMIEQDKIDCYKFPRREMIDGEENKGPYPDIQARLFRTYCRFIRPIHEEVVGWKECKELDKDSSFDIMHNKTSGRHQSRNGTYPLFGMHYIHEWGKPGEQTKDTVIKPVNLIQEEGK